MNQGCNKKYFIFISILLLTLFFCLSSSNATEPTYAVTISIVEGDVFKAGETFHTITEIRNSKASGRVDVVLTYEVLNENNQMIVTETTTVAVETLSSFSEDIKIPDSASEGFYVLKATVTSLDGVQQCQTSVSFSVTRQVAEEEQRFIEFIMAGGLIFTVTALIFEHRRVSKLKVGGNDIKRFVVNKKNK